MFAPSVLVRTSPVIPSCCQWAGKRGWGGIPRGSGTSQNHGDAKVLAFWLEGLSHQPIPGSRTEQQGVGVGLCLHPRAQAQTRVQWPEGRSALAQALWCQLGLERPMARRRAQVNPGGLTPAPGPRLLLGPRAVPGLTWKGL